MEGNQVTWSMYEGFGAGPQLSAEQLEHLNKALTAGASVNNPGTSAGEGFPLRVESLERTLKNVTYRMEHIRLWKALTKLPAFNTVEEHNEISSYGQGEEGFVSEGALPSEDDSTYARKTAIIKYLGTTRKVTHPMSLVKPAHGNVIANETVSGTMWLLRIIERALFEANSDLSALQFDGFKKLIGSNAPAANIIDLRGAPLDEDVLIDAALTVSDAPNYGIPTHLHLNPRAKADLVKTFFPKARYDLLEKKDGGMVGLDMKGFTSPAGDVAFEPNVFITDGGAPTVAAVGPSASIPSAPTVSTALAASSSVTSQFTADDEGTYTYKAYAHNDYGHSAPVAVGSQAVLSGQKVTFSLTPAGGNASKWFSIFRSIAGGSDTRLIKRIAVVGGAQVITDNNEDLPFTTNGYLWQQNTEVMSWKQLAPMLKIPLATIDASIRWMQLIYGVPVLYAPGKSILFKNIGRAPGSVGTP